MSIRVCLLVFLWASHAWAANPERWGPTMLPQSGVRLDFGSSENRLTASINRLFFQGPLGPLRLGLVLSAPTNTAAQHSVTIDPGYFPFGYTGKFSIAWDTLYYTRYAVHIPALLQRTICGKLKSGVRCRAQSIEVWLQKHKKQTELWKKLRQVRKGWQYKWRQTQQKLQRRWHLLRQLATTLLTVPFDTSLRRRCRTFLLAGKSAQARQKPLQVTRKNCYLAVERARISQQKAALAHRLWGLKEYRKLTKNAKLYEAFVQFKAALAQRQRDLSRRMPPILPKSFGRSLFYSLGLDVFGSLRMLSAYPSLQAQTQSDYFSYTLQVGPSFSLYLSPRLSFHLRAGLAFQVPLSTRQGKRCQAIPGKEKGLEQRRCEYVNVLDEPARTNTQLYARGGVTALFDLDCCSTTVGVEVRAGLENLSFEEPGKGALFEMQLVLFSVSKITHILGRFHVGVHLGIPLGVQDKTVPTAGLFVLPFVGFGGGL